MNRRIDHQNQREEEPLFDEAARRAIDTVLKHRFAPHGRSIIETFLETPPKPTRSCYEIGQTLKQKYDLPIVDLYQLGTIAEAINAGNYHGMDLERLRQLSVLDIACGNATDGSIANQVGQWQPWLCRALHAIGAKVVGIDRDHPTVNPKSGKGVAEDWQWHQAYLVFNRDTIHRFFGRLYPAQFDVVNTASFIEHIDPKYNAYLSLSTDSKTSQQVTDSCFWLALHTLKPGGLFVVNETYIYQKTHRPGQPNFMHFKIFKAPEGTPEPGYCVVHPTN